MLWVKAQELEISMRFVIVAAAVWALAKGAEAQVVITAEDMFNQVGQYYKAFANKDDVPVSGILGTPGGPQVWDFTTGPTDDVYQFDYVLPTDDGHGVDFPEATFAERKTEQLSGAKNWMYLKQVPQLGRVNYGFYDEEFSPTKPSNPFKTPITDFPAVIRYDDTWSTATSFDSEISFDTGPDPENPDAGSETFTIPMRVNYTSTAKADAYGIVNLPQIGFGEALRVNELSTYAIDVDFEGTGNFQNVTTEYVRTIYFLMEDRGIAVQVTSRQETTPPPDNFALAASVVRMFETNHGIGGSTPESITDFKITLSQGKALLNWAKLGTVTSYRVEATSELVGGTWTVVGTTSNNFLVDSSIGGVGQRYYRVVGVK